MNDIFIRALGLQLFNSLGYCNLMLSDTRLIGDSVKSGDIIGARGCNPKKLIRSNCTMFFEDVDFVHVQSLRNVGKYKGRVVLNVWHHLKVEPGESVEYDIIANTPKKLSSGVLNDAVITVKRVSKGDDKIPKTAGYKDGDTLISLSVEYVVHVPLKCYTTDVTIDVC